MIKISAHEQKHDEGYKSLLSKKENFLHFLKKYIAVPWTADISIDDIEKIDKSFITREYRKTDSDLIYKLNMNGSDVYLYVLLEMQSTVDFTMPFRLLRYMVELLTDIFKNTDKNIRERKSFKLPAIVPIVMYNGADNWTAVRNYREYTHSHEIFGDSIVDFRYLLFDLNRADDETIASTRKLLDAVFSLDKVNSDVDDYIFQALNQLSKWKHSLGDDEINELWGWLEYIYFKGKPPQNLEGFIKQIFKKDEVSGMTHSLERWRDKQTNIGIQIGLERGMEKGRQEGRQEGIQEGMEKGIQETIERFRRGGMSDEEINKFLH